MPKRTPHTSVKSKVERTPGVKSSRGSAGAMKRISRLLEEVQVLGRIGAWDVDMATGETFWTDNLYRLYGFEPGELPDPQNAFHNITLHPDDKDKIERLTQQVIDTKKMISTTFRIRRNGEGVRTMHGVVVPDLDEDGNVSHLYGVNQDITEQQRVEDALMDSWAKHKEAQLLALMGHWELDFQTDTIQWSDGVYHLFDLGKDEFSGKYEDFLDLIHPEDKIELQERFARAVSGEEPYDFSHRVIRKGGEVRYVRERCDIHYDEKGHPKVALGTTLDITELVQSRELMEKALMGIGAGLIVIAADTLQIENLNDKALDILNVDRDEYLWRPATILPWCRSESTDDYRKQLYINLGETQELSLTIPGIISLPIQRTVLADTLAGQERFIEIIFDISERKELERRLVLAQKLESIGQLSAGIAHEISTPAQYLGDNLTFVQNELHHLADQLREYRTEGARADLNWNKRHLDYLIEELPVAVRGAQDGVGRISTIVQAMKRFSHPGDEGMQMADINKALEVTSTISRNEWKYYADVKFDFDKTLPTVECCINSLNQVFLNLMMNAAHAVKQRYKDTDEKGVILITTRDGGDHVQVTIEDSGMGMSQAVLSRVFDPFFTTKEVGQGTGQGLTLCYSVIVDNHGGLIDLHSKEGVGTICKIKLPKTQPEQF